MTPRRLAVKALIHQEQAGYANLVLDAELKKCDPPMNTRDAAFAARIFYTTLERLPLLDYTIDRYTKSRSPNWTPRCVPCYAAGWPRPSICRCPCRRR